MKWEFMIVLFLFRSLSLKLILCMSVRIKFIHIIYEMKIAFIIAHTRNNVLVFGNSQSAVFYAHRSERL